MESQEFSSLSKLSFSFATFMAMDEWSNVITKDKKGNYNLLELYGKKFVTASTYLVLSVIAIVEGAVRGFFALCVLPFAFCISGKQGEWFRTKIFMPLSSGAMISFSTTTLSLMGFGYNFKKPTEVVTKHLNLILSRKIETEEKTLSSSEKVYAAYYRGIKSFIDCLDSRNWSTVSTVLGTPLLELPSAFRVVCNRIIHGWSDTPHFSNINPVSLTKEQLKISPVLCIHGSYHHPSGFTGLAKSLKDAYSPAVFTVRLNSGRFSQEDERRVVQRIEEIKALYASYGVHDITIDIVGHSRGASVAELFSQEGWDWKKWKWADGDDNSRLVLRKGIGKVVLMGYHDRYKKLIEHFKGKYYEINAKYEACLSKEALDDAIEKAAIDPDHRIIVNACHLSVSFNSQAHEAIARWLKPRVVAEKTLASG